MEPMLTSEYSSCAYVEGNGGKVQGEGEKGPKATGRRYLHDRYSLFVKEETQYH